MEQPRPRRAREGSGVARSLDIDRGEILRGCLELEPGGAVHDQIKLLRRSVETEAGAGHVSPQQSRMANKSAVVGSNFGAAADQRGHLVAPGGEPGAQFAADEPRGAGDEDLQQSRILGTL